MSIGNAFRAWVATVLPACAGLAVLGAGPLPQPAAPIVLDALCRVPAAGAKAYAPGKRSPGTIRMAERLRLIRDAADPASMAYLNDRLVPLIESALTNADSVQDRFRHGMNLAVQLNQSGRPDAALNTFAGLELMLARSNAVPNERTLAEIRLRKGLAYLRLGEQENCLANHGPESCLFPLTPAAYHVLPRGSRAAAGVFEEQLRAHPDDLRARWLLNLAHMTLGEYPAKVPPAFLIPPSVFASEAAMPRFPDVAARAGLDLENLAGGVIVDDFDNDGFLDVMASSWSLDGQLRFFRNDGDGHFTERTSEAGLVGLTGGLNLIQTDYDNDGFLDVYIPRGAWLGKAGRIPGSLLHNNGDGTFSDVTESSGLASSRPSQAVRWLDYDGDGWLDLFKGNESVDPDDPDPCELFHNNRDGTFTEVAASCGIGVSRFVKGVACADYNHDGRPDLYLSVRNGRNLLFRNDGPDPAAPGRWRFTEVGGAAGVTMPKASFPTWFFDYDNDGWEDLFCSGYGIDDVGDIAADYLGLPGRATLPKLYRNKGDGTFEDVTVAMNVNRVCHTMGCNFGDLDNDGWLDFYCATGDPDLSTLIPNRMFRNDGGKRFQDVTTATGTGHLQKGHAVAFADIDNDGDQDVYVVMGGAYTGDVARNALFLNPGTTNHWLKLRLVGVRANRPAIGATVRVDLATPAGPRSLHRTVGTGASFGANPLRQELGLGDATAVTRVEIRWPGSGTRQVLEGLLPDHAYEVREGDAAAKEVSLRRLQIGGLPPAADHAARGGTQ